MEMWGFLWVKEGKRARETDETERRKILEGIRAAVDVQKKYHLKYCVILIVNIEHAWTFLWLLFVQVVGELGWN